MVITLIIALTTYVSMVFFTKYRTPISAIGAAALLLYGTASGAFPANLAFQKFPTEIVILIVVLALFSKVFENIGIFDVIGNWFYRISKGRKIIIAVLVPLIIYSVSLFMNNLSAVLLFVFICLELGIKLKLPVAPLLVSAVIGSNIGGAPLPWADTPAVVITLASDFNLYDFLNKLFLPCLAYIVLLVWYTVWWFKKEEKNMKEWDETAAEDNINFDPIKDIPPIVHPHPIKQPLVEKIEIPPHAGGPKPVPPHLRYKEKELKDNKTLWQKSKIPAILFFLVIVFICIAPFYNVSIAYVSLFFAGVLLLTRKENPDELLNTLPVLDSLSFISALFLIAGSLEYSGILKAIVDDIMMLTNGNSYLIVLSIMFSAFMIATFLSAGPAAATLLPICNQLSPTVGNRIVYAALALGILAGSSMLPWSATGGPVMMSEVNRFLSERDIKGKKREMINKVFNLKHYLAFSIPFSLVILVLSGFFLCLYVALL